MTDLANPTSSEQLYNPYQAPNAPVRDLGARANVELAERGQRLGAHLLDGLLTLPIYAIALLPILLMPESDAAAAICGLLFLVGFLGYCSYQILLVRDHGATFGKRKVGIKMVRLDGSRMSASRFVFLRSLLVGILGALPFLGAFFALANVLFILGNERRCLHDHIADTIVIKA